MDVQSKIAPFFEQYPLQTYDKRQIILQPNELIHSIFYITDGRVSQYDIAPNGNEIVVNIFKPGAFFPMGSAINNIENAYFFEASLTTSLRVAPKPDVLKFLEKNPDVTFDLLARVYRGVDGVLRRMAHLMGGDARSRLIFELLNAAYRFGVQQPNNTIHIALTESDVAKHSGLARETVSRLLQELKSANLITTSRGSISIVNIRTLEAELGTRI